ncbi:MAG: TIGR03619 family F420-dependent LLM class oxidoreductase [Gammaproteobacteria bacterium]|nr:TIGR03619 family F420-dependent LLM class oxidoreductase [Gammaproteobacteria bacterium]
MDIGVMIFPTDTSIQPVELAKEVEARGFESLWFPEHSHIPVSRETPWGGREGAPPLPEMYWRAHDQFVALGACAAVTEKIRLGTGITLVAQRDAIWLAKEVASLDMISNGRFELGVGYGWCKEEMRNHGLAFKDRRALLREKILLMKELWAQDEASYSGEHIQFEKSWAWPKPTQKPHPPIVMGGAIGPQTAAHVAEFCDGWLPLGGAHDVAAGWRRIREACEKVGRDPASLSLSMFYARAVKPDAMKAHADMGARRAIMPLPSKWADAVLPLLDQYAALIG